MVDWLEGNALSNLESYPVKVNYFADSVTWENTLHDIEHGIGRGHIVTEMVSGRGGGGGGALISSVVMTSLLFHPSLPPLPPSFQDPDAPVRQHRHLSELDAKDELSLSKHLFACIRAGQLSKV